MSFDVLVLPDLFNDLPPTFGNNVKSAIRNLNDHFPGTGKGEKKEIKGADNVAYRLRVGSFRVFYRIDKEDRIVYVFDILTAEQAHKKYGRL